MSPAPSKCHQRAVKLVCMALESACPTGFEVFFAPLDWRPDPGTSLDPDVLVVRAAPEAH